MTAPPPKSDLPTPLSLSLSKAPRRGARFPCFDKLSMSGVGGAMSASHPFRHSVGVNAALYSCPSGARRERRKPA